MLMPRQNGVRHRGPGRQPPPSLRSGWVNNAETRAELLGNRVRNADANAITIRQAQQSQAAMEAQLHAIAEQQASMAEQSSRAADNLLAGQATIRAATTDLKQATREIKAITAETLTVTKRVEKGVRELKTMLRSPGGAASMMLNPFFALIVFYLSHPYLPVTIETMMPIWSVILSVNYVKQLGMKISNGESLITLEGGVLGLAKNLVFNAPHAIVLMWKLSQMWTEERTGTRGYGAERSAAFAATMEPSNWEPFIAATFANTMEGIRNISLQDLQNMTIPGVPRVNMTEMRDYLESVSNHTYTELQELDPILFKDKAGIIQLLLEYIGGKLIVKARSVGVATLNMPAYLFQARTLMTAEAWVFQTVLCMVKDIYVKVFKDIGEAIATFICTALCAYAPEAKVKSVNAATAAAAAATATPAPAKGGMTGAGFGDWLSGTYKASVDTITNKFQDASDYTKRAVVDAGKELTGMLVGKIAIRACDCEKYGKLKMDGGSGSSRSSRSSRKSTKSKSSKTRKSAKSVKRLHVPADHAEFLRLSWRYVMYLIAPAITGLPIFPTQSEFLALDAEWSDLLLKKVEGGHFVPPILLTGVQWSDYMLE